MKHDIISEFYLNSEEFFNLNFYYKKKRTPKDDFPYWVYLYSPKGSHTESNDALRHRALILH